ncbi:hypothetical protein [Humisphaera borealis]|uniref:DUF2892 domain-containing protein n=1 Tax=Humisphaera borealis TaxID=2807512 RepID=A0A7M2X3M7_9BACT|nr:hypothetical protein [Humisphaera borealis]QOV91370.1 hypothetical protein IPV69_08465 [Humisphaera borealis]
MALTCNIDAKGKVARLIFGLIMIAVGIVTAVFWAVGTGGWLPWTVSAALVAFGAFGVFEARAGWCVMRAMGFKTSM